MESFNALHHPLTFEAALKNPECKSYANCKILLAYALLKCLALLVAALPVFC